MIDPEKWGVSFSVKQCRAFNIDPNDTLRWLMYFCGFKRFRLMSYWNEHEKSPGVYDFTALDTQVLQIEQAGGQITLCLGARQPRWPENHWPDWAWELPKPERTVALLKYIEKVVNRYKDRPSIISWQLENEALLKQFGRRPEVDRARLRAEHALVRTLDTSRPIIMSTSNGWGIPLRAPIPDIVGFSYYGIVHSHGRYHPTIHRPWLYRFRKYLIWFWHDRSTFIHELQCEPWGPTAIWKMPIDEQNKSMDPKRIARLLGQARSIDAYPIDLWGGEWWYWRAKTHQDPTIWLAVEDGIKNQN